MLDSAGSDCRPDFEDDADFCGGSPTCSRRARRCLLRALVADNSGGLDASVRSAEKRSRRASPARMGSQTSRRALGDKNVRPRPCSGSEVVRFEARREDKCCAVVSSAQNVAQCDQPTDYFGVFPCIAYNNVSASGGAPCAPSNVKQQNSKLLRTGVIGWSDTFAHTNKLNKPVRLIKFLRST